MLDQVQAKPESENPEEQVLAEEQTNLALDQGKTRCIPQIILVFYF
jgi:hypothetical protein